MTSERELEELRALLQERLLQNGSYRLASGKTSSYYFDGKRSTFGARESYLIGKLALERVRRYDVAAIGGLAIGSIPITIAASLVSGQEGVPLPGFCVRTSTKDHGTKDQIAQYYVDGQTPVLREGVKVAIVDDVLTTGKSIKQAIDVVEAEGVEVAIILVLVDRHDPDSAKLKEQYHVESLFEADATGNLSITRQAALV